MYAVVECGGRQYRVEPGLQFEVNRLEGDPGSEVVLDRVLLVGGEDGGVRIGQPVVTGVTVKCKVLRQGKGRKIHAFQYKAKKNMFRHYGHRQAITILSVSSIG